MIPGDVPHAMQVLAALEEWCAHEGDERRLVAFEFVETWRAYITRGTQTTEHTGRTLADALAQAAQVVVSDPDRIGAR